MPTSVIPQPDVIEKMSVHELQSGLKALGERGAGLLTSDAPTNDDLATVAEIQKATALMGERLDAIIAAKEAAKGFDDLQREAAEKAEKAGLGGTPPTKKEIAEHRGLPRDLWTAIQKAHGGKQAIAAWKERNQAPSGSMVIPVDALHKADWLKGFREAMSDEDRAEYGEKAVLGTDDDLTYVDTEYPPRTVRLDGVIDERFAQRNIAELFPNYPWQGEAVEFVREDVLAQGAAETLEGDLANEASIDFESDSTPVRKITAMLPVTMEGLNLESWLRGHVQNRLRLFVELRENLQILRGTGASNTLIGINHADGIQTEFAGASPDGQALAEAIFAAAIKVGQAFITPSAAIVNLATWQHLRLAKDEEDRYLNLAITEGGIPRVFGLPLHFNEMQDGIGTAGNGNVVATVVSREAAAVFRRMGIAVTWTDSHSDRFARDVTTFKATSRLALAVLRPAGICVVKNSLS